MTTKSSKKSRSSYSSYSYSHAAKSAKTSHRHGSLSLSFSYGATDDYTASASSLDLLDEEPVIIVIPAEESTISPSAVAEHDDDNEAASSTSDVDVADSSILTVSTAVPQSPSATTELDDGGTNMMSILTIDDLSPPPYVNLSLADSVSIKELASPPNETPGNIAPTLSKVGIIGITIVAAIMFVFALARGKNRYEQQQQRRRRSRGCDHGEVATDLEAFAGAAEQEDDENISDLSSVWSADDHAPEQRNLE
eukprot:scaffold11574_cov132-Skeletonema_dohrnii-CCMP3373.AAC.3